MTRLAIVAVGILGFSGYAIDSQGAPQAAAIPDFAPSSDIGWIAADQLFLPPEKGPGPVMADPVYLSKPGQDAFRVADLANPILQPWAREELRKVNERALSGKPAYTPKERCWPIGVPGFVLYPVFPTYFIQTPKEVVMIWAEDHQVRHIYLNQRHSTRVKPSWFGESVGRYEGDTLVVDTIGLNTRTFIDSYRTPHTDKLHVVERFRTIDGGRTMEVRLHVEGAGAFTTAWDAMQRYRRVDSSGDARDPRVPRNGLEEMVCAENNGDILNEGLEAIPTADRPDF